MKEECLICQAPLEYLGTETLMECALCHRQEMSQTRCINGHYVCNECHTKGMDAVIGYCPNETSKNPVEILDHPMSLPFCHMHGPEHHTLVGAALPTAYRNAGGEIELLTALKEMMARGRKVPGGACGFWGSCGAAISTGMCMSILSGATPLTQESWGQKQPDDGPVAAENRGSGRSPLLQAQLLPVPSGGCRIFPSNKGCHTGNETNCLPPLRC